MGLFDLLKAIFNAFCIPEEPKPQPQHTQHPQPQHPQHPQQPHYPPPSKPSKPEQQPWKPHGQDDNQINQSNEYYVSLRTEANEHGDRMARCFDESQQAYTSGDGARAKELSNEGKAHKAKMEELNRQASEWIFRENNRDSGPNEVDLHGLYVREAIAFTDRAIEDAKRRGDSEVHLIVGKGLHSASGAKVKPAIEDLMRKHRLQAALDPNNAGVLIVQLNAERGRGLGVDELTRRIERDDERCVIM